MKICFIIPSMVGGGAERVTANLANRLDEMGHEVNILMTASDDVEYELNENILVRQISRRTHGSFMGRVQRILTLRSCFKEDRKAVYISMDTETNMFAALATVFMSVNLVVSERSNPDKFRQKKLRNFAYLFVRKIVFQTNGARLCFSRRLQKAGRIIPNPIVSQNPENHSSERTKRFVAVGRLEPVKNYKMLLKAFSTIANKYMDYDLYIYGKGSQEQELRELCNQLQMNSRVHFEGFCDNVQERIKDATAYILSSDYEGMSNSLLEAMAMGLPVISTDCPVGGSRMLIEHGKNGLLTPVGDVNSMAAAMEHIIMAPQKAYEMGKEAAKVNEKYSIQRITNEWLTYMKE